MKQFFAIDENLNLGDNDYHHIKNVIRMKKNDIIQIIYDKVIYTCKIKDLDKTVKVSVIKKNIREEKNKLLIVAFALLNEQKIDYLLQKSTELGCDRFVPFLTTRSKIKYDFKKDDKKTQRWQKIIESAAKQCHRDDVPIINGVIAINDLINYDADLKILCTVNEKTKNIKKVIQNNNNYDKILIVTGPEGGFEKKEEELLISNGFIPCSLGNNVLRSETAPVVALSMINYEFMR